MVVPWAGFRQPVQRRLQNADSQSDPDNSLITNFRYRCQVRQKGVLRMVTPTTTFSDVGSAVLEDPTGRRARWMRRAGRVVFVVFLGWLLAIVLGGLGLVPVDGIPLTHALRPSAGPAPLAKLPQPRQPSASDLRPAATATAAANASAASRPAQSVPVRQHGRSATAPGQTKTTTVSARPGRSATAPGHTQTTTTTSHGRSTTAPGHTKTTTTHGRSTTSPGHTQTTTTVPHGQSSTAPGKQKH